MQPTNLGPLLTLLDAKVSGDHWSWYWEPRYFTSVTEMQMLMRESTGQKEKQAPTTTK